MLYVLELYICYFFENYIAVEAGERNTVSDYLEEVVLENEIKGQEDVRKRKKER